MKENIGLPGDSGRIGVRTMTCHTRWAIKVDALGSITSNCTVLRSTPDDAKDVDRARYGDEGKNLRHFVSNEQIPLPVRDHIGRTTAETRQQLQLKSAAHVASATKVKVLYVDEAVETLNRPLSRRLYRCDRMIQNEGNDSRKLFTLKKALCR